MEAIFEAWHPSWKNLPWKFWTNPVERFEVFCKGKAKNFRLLHNLFDILGLTIICYWGIFLYFFRIITFDSCF